MEQTQDASREEQEFLFAQRFPSDANVVSTHGNRDRAEPHLIEAPVKNSHIKEASFSKRVLTPTLEEEERGAPKAVAVKSEKNAFQPSSSLPTQCDLRFAESWGEFGDVTLVPQPALAGKKKKKNRKRKKQPSEEDTEGSLKSKKTKKDKGKKGKKKEKKAKKDSDAEIAESNVGFDGIKLEELSQEDLLSSKSTRNNKKNSYSFGKGASNMKTAIQYTHELLRAQEAGMKYITIRKGEEEHRVNSISKIATVFKVPKTTLYGRYKGDPESTVKPGRREAFPLEVEEMIVRHIEWLVHNGFALSWVNVRTYAQRLATHHKVQGFKASHTWLQHLMMRHEGCATSLKLASERLKVASVAAEPPTDVDMLLTYLSQLETEGSCPTLGDLTTAEDIGALYILYEVLKDSQAQKEARSLNQRIEKERRRSMGIKEKRNRYKNEEDLQRMEKAVAAAQKFEDAKVDGKKSVEIEVNGVKHEVSSVTQIKDLFNVPSQTLRSWVEKKNKFLVDLPGSLNKDLLRHLHWMANKGLGFDWQYVHARASELAKLAKIEGFRPQRWAKKFRMHNPELLNVMHTAARNIHENKHDEIPNPLIGLDKICNQLMMDLRELDMVRQTQILSKFEEMILHLKHLPLGENVERDAAKSDFQNTSDIESTDRENLTNGIQTNADQAPREPQPLELATNYPIPPVATNLLDHYNNGQLHFSTHIQNASQSEIMPAPSSDAMPLPMNLDPEGIFSSSNYQMFNKTKEMSV